MVSNRWLAVVVSIAMLAAGCLGSGNPQSPHDALASPGSAQFDESTGGIEGIVLDDQSLPVGEAHVSVIGLDLAARTGPDGTFGFSFVPPGQVELAAAKPGYENSAVTVQVEEGRITSAKLILVALPSDEAYHRIDQMAGQIQCAVQTRSPPVPFVTGSDGRTYFGACSTLLGFAGLSIDRAFLVFPPEPFARVEGVLGESTWESTQVLGRSLHVMWFLRHPEFPGYDTERTGGWTLNHSAGPSPVRVPMPIERFEEAVDEAEYSVSCREVECGMAVSHSAWAETVPSSPVDVGVVFDQQFDVFRTMFFGAPSPPQFSALPDS